MPRKKKTSTTAAKKAPQTKAGFVRSLPANLTAKEVVAKAKTANITVTEKQVYNIRSAARVARKAKRAKANGRSSARPANGAPARPAAARSAEDVLRAVGAELGLAHAIAVLEDEHRRVRRLISG
jgi:hypothetical protein